MAEDGWRRRRVAILALAVVAWWLGFAILRRFGTWTPFALAGPALAALALATDREVRALLRPSFQTGWVGVLTGLLMLGLTHAAFTLVAPRFPAARAASVELYALLNVSGFSPLGRAGLIVVIASCEEIVFRGSLLGGASSAEGRALQRVLSLAFAYAVAMATLGSALLIACAFGCAVLWGALRVATRSLVAPMLAHVVWDLGVLVFWPLVLPGG